MCTKPNSCIGGERSFTCTPGALVILRLTMRSSRIKISFFIIEKKLKMKFGFRLEILAGLKFAISPFFPQVEAVTAEIWRVGYTDVVLQCPLL